jgi:hypothetical protein
MKNDPTQVPDEADDAADLTHCAALYATAPITLRTMRMVAQHQGLELAAQRGARLVVRRALAELSPAMDEQHTGEAQRVAVLAMQLHLQHVLQILNDPTLSTAEVESLILSARGRTIAAQRKARAL